MNLTHICYDAKGIEKLGLDYIIVGSDEVWNYRETKGNAKVKFGIGLNNEKLIAYAPSVGQTNDLEVPDYVKQGILKFKAVSARDALTEKLAENIRGEKIERVVDPTFLSKIPVEAKEELNLGKKVLFSGTPCQIAGLYGYLRREYENLFTVDVICHGVPSAKMFDDFLQNETNKRNVKKIKEYIFRDKKRGWGMNGKIRFELKNGSEKTVYIPAIKILK